MRLEAVIAGMFGGVSDYRFLPRGGDGGAGLRGVELAGLLAGLDGVAVDLAYAYYAGNVDAEAKLKLRMQVYAVGLGVDRGWCVGDGNPTLSAVGVLSVVELLGAGVAGSGRQRAEFVGVSKDAWRRVWADRYALVWGYLCGVHDVVRLTIARNSR
jgi:hypothetical protein